MLRRSVNTAIRPIAASVRTIHSHPINLASTTSSQTPSQAQSASSSSSSSAHVSARSGEWGPKTRHLSFPSVASEVSSSSSPSHSTPSNATPRRPIKHSRLEKDQPNSTTEQYDLISAVVVERWPKVLKEEPEWRRTYENHFAELRKAKKPEHQLPKELQVQTNEEQKASSGSVNPDDLLTEADRANDLHATHRCLQDSLYLVVKRRGAPQWSLPSGQVPFDITTYHTSLPDQAVKLASTSISAAAALLTNPPPPKHTLRSVAAAAISSTIGTHAGVYFIGNAPIAVHRHQYKQPKAPIADAKGPSIIGSKTFFMHALYMDGEVRMQNAREYDDYAWVKKDQLSEYIGEEQANVLKTALLEPEYL